jgi:hypothetical protein
MWRSRRKKAVRRLRVDFVDVPLSEEVEDDVEAEGDEERYGQEKRGAKHAVCTISTLNYPIIVGRLLVSVKHSAAVGTNMKLKITHRSVRSLR